MFIATINNLFNKVASISPILNYISFNLNICCQFITTDHCVNKITIINALLLLNSYTLTWKVIKQNFLYKSNDLITTELIPIHDQVT